MSSTLTFVGIIALVICAIAFFMNCFFYGNKNPSSIKKYLIAALVSVSVIIIANIDFDAFAPESSPVEITEVKAEPIPASPADPLPPAGVLNQIYRINTKYKTASGSFIIVNFQSIKKYKEFTNNKGAVLKNVIVIENVLPLDDTISFLKNTGYFTLVDGKNTTYSSLEVAAQSGVDFTDIILIADIPVDNFNSVIIGCFEKTDGAVERKFSIEALQNSGSDTGNKHDYSVILIDSENAAKKSALLQNAVADKWRDEDDSVTAWVMVENAIRDKLAPERCDFPGVLSPDRDVRRHPDQIYDIISYVETKNAYGVKIRTRFIAKIHQKEKGKWTLERLEFQ